MHRKQRLAFCMACFMPTYFLLKHTFTLIASCAMVKFGVHGVSEEDGVTKQPSKGEHHERHVDYNRICRH